jgi:HAD superfamily hydrolase (TIGR01509 family)
MFSVIFDMDGTLLDTQRICIPAWEYAGEQQGFKGAGKLMPLVCGMNLNGSNKVLTDHYPNVDLEKFRTDSREYIKEHLEVRFMKGAKELLDYLKGRGVKIGLATGTSRPSVLHHLKAVNALEYFDALVCGTEIENGKPAPDIFLKTAELLGADPKTCFVFEDSPNGIIAGHSAGMKAIGIPDVVTFSDDIKSLMYCELKDLSQAIEIFEKL